MKKVGNKAGYPVPIMDNGKQRIIPYDHRAYLISDKAFTEYGDFFINLPLSQPELDKIAAIETETKRQRTLTEQQRIEEQSHLEVDNIVKFFDKHANDTVYCDDSKIDVLYSYHFSKDEKAKSLLRLKTSIASIINQNVTVCVCNTSKFCIKKDLAEFPGIKYIHKYLPGEYCKPKTINFGVKNLIGTTYFVLSDIDLIYQPEYIEVLKKKYISKNIKCRVVTYNYNLGYEMYSPNFREYLQYIYVRDPKRTHYAISPGNGLVYLPCFYLARGLDESFYGYGAEDAELNKRLSIICKYVEDDDPYLRTIHIFHDRAATEQNFEKYRKTVDTLDLEFKNRKFDVNLDLEFIQSNKDKEKWGVLK